MGSLLYTEEITGSMKEFASLARPIWDEKYREILLLDMFSLEYLETIKQSTQECYGLATYYKKEPLCLCLNLGYKAEFFGRPLRVLLMSWFSAVSKSSSTGTAVGLAGIVQLCLDIVETAKKRNYDLVLGIADANSGMLNAAKIKSKGISPFISQPIVAMARILSKQAMEKMYLNGYEKLLLKILGKEWKESRPDQNEVEEIPLSKQGFCEDILNNEVAYDIKIINEFSQYYPQNKSFNKFFRLFEIKRKGKRIGIIRILDLPLQGVDLIPSVIIEQIWAEPHQLRTCLTAFISAMKREGKKMILSIFALPRVWERFILLSLGFLPDYSRPVRVVSIATNPEIEKRLNEIKSFSLPFR